MLRARDGKEEEAYELPYYSAWEGEKKFAGWGWAISCVYIRTWGSKDAAVTPFEKNATATGGGG